MAAVLLDIDKAFNTTYRPYIIR